MDPEASQLLGPAQFHQLGALAASAYGNYDLAIQHRKELDAAIQRNAAEQVLSGMRLQALGGDSEFPGPLLTGYLTVREGLQAAGQHAEQLTWMGLTALEAGQVQEAAEYFRRAIEDVHGDSVYRPLAGRYYHLITGKWLR
jgi:tetratricopeptide (TPR) repeat protein